MNYPNINDLSSYREFSEIYTNESLLEENLHMKRYQILPTRYMSINNEKIKRFLIYHSQGTGKSFTVLWILLNFIDFYEKPAIILVKSQESIFEFKRRIASWYSYTFNYYKPPAGINDYQQFINKYIEFHTYITFCKSVENIEDINIYEDRLIIIDEIHHFRNTVENKFIHTKIHKFLNSINNSRVIFMSATPIFDNYNEISSLIKLIIPNVDCNLDFTPGKVEKIMKGHISYYGLNPPDTSVTFIGSSIPGINQYKIFDIPMQGIQLQKYQNFTKYSYNKYDFDTGINLTKTNLGVINLEEPNSNMNSLIDKNRYLYIF